MSEMIVEINPGLCDGCGVCITSCDEDVLEMVDGKACLVDEACCIGLGECLSSCPTGALSLKQRRHNCGY